MRLRKFTTLLTVATISVGLGACGSDKKTDPKDSGSTTTVEGALPDLGGKTVTIAVENAYVPFNYINKDTKKAEGYDYEVWAESCKRLNCKADFKQAAWEGMIQAVADGQFDAAGDGITVTEERAKIVDFSTGYIQVKQRMLVKKGEARFADLDAFKAGDFKAGTQTGTTNYETGEKEYGKSRVKAFETFPFAVQALLNGDVDGVLIDDTAGQGYIGADSEKLEMLDGELKSDDLGFAFPKGKDLVTAVNKALEAMKADGTLAKINGKYFDKEFEAPVADG